MKSRLLCGATLLLFVAGCSEKATENSSASYAPSDQMAEVSESGGRAPGAPNVAITAAPGVAFNYQYAFRLDDNKISKVQEEHASACETLGVTRCRITGLSYRLIRDNEVEGQLQFKLDPAIARKFGKDAISSVEKAEGVLAAAHITGDDVGSQISESQKRSAALAADLARIEQRLATPGLGDRERAELRQQAANLRTQLDREQGTRSAGEASLATTPMSFDYVGTGGLPGIGYGNPFSDALNMLIRSGGTLLSFVLVVGAAVLPWAGLFALLMLLWRTRPALAIRRWLHPAKASTPEPEAK